MKRTSFCLGTALVLLILPAIMVAQPSKLPIDASHSVISFSVGFAGEITSIDGRFNTFEGEIGYKTPGDRSTFYTDVIIDVASLKTGDDQRDKDLMGETFFNTEKYPKITFSSKKAVKVDQGWHLMGTLNMVGVEKELEIPFQFTHEAAVAWVFGEPRIAAKANFDLNRLEFKIPSRGWSDVIPTLGSMMLSENVTINLTIQGVGASLIDILLETLESKGTEAAFQTYESKKSKNEGYSFGAQSIVGVSSQLIRSGKFDQAIEFSKFAVKQDPDNYIGYYYLGLSYKSSGDKKSAITNFEKAIKIKPDLERAKKHIEELKK